MKRSLLSVRPVLSIGIFFLLALTLAACTKFKDSDNAGTPVAGLMAFNLAPDKAGIGIALSNNNLVNAPLTYTNYTGSYQRVYAGIRTVESFDAASDSTLSITEHTFEPDKFYSLFVVGANGIYRNILTHDNFDSLSNSSGQAYIRYINAIPDSSNSKITIAGSGVNLVDANTTFTTVSDFLPVTPGEINIAINKEANINTNRTISVEKGKVYTVLLVDIPDEADSAKTVQIKYITNGSLINEQ